METLVRNQLQAAAVLISEFAQPCPAADRNDLGQLFTELFVAATLEERASAIETIVEILQQRRGKVMPMDCLTAEEVAKMRGETSRQIELEFYNEVLGELHTPQGHVIGLVHRGRHVCPQTRYFCSWNCRKNYVSLMQRFPPDTLTYEFVKLPSGNFCCAHCGRALRNEEPTEESK